MQLLINAMNQNLMSITSNSGYYFKVFNDQQLRSKSTVIISKNKLDERNDVIINSKVYRAAVYTFTPHSNSFMQLNLISSVDPLKFQFNGSNFQQQLNAAQVKTKQLCAMNCTEYDNYLLLEQNFAFLGGTLGGAEGHVIVLATEYLRNLLFSKILVIKCSSGGVRMQEGILGLSQMAATVGVLAKFRQEGGVVVSIFSDPCFGGASASFMHESDVRIGIKEARSGFAGPAVIQQTMFNNKQDDYDKNCPIGFQSVERQQTQGFIDIVTEDWRQYVETLSKLVIEARHNQFSGFSEIDSATKQISFETFSYKECRKPTNLQPVDYLQAIAEPLIDLFQNHPLKLQLSRLNSQLIFSLISFKDFQDPKTCGLGTPTAYRQMVRFFDFINKLRLPLITIIDIPGALPSFQAEDLGQSQAISQCLQSFMCAKVPIVSVISGEGGSGGALAVTTANFLIMTKFSYFNVISPEGGVSILCKDLSQFEHKCEQLAISQKCFSFNCYEMGVADYIAEQFSIKQQIITCLNQCTKIDLMNQRIQKYCDIGKYLEVSNKQNYLEKLSQVQAEKKTELIKDKNEVQISPQIKNILTYISEKTIASDSRQNVNSTISMPMIPDIQNSYKSCQAMSFKQVLYKLGRKAVIDELLKKKQTYITDTSFRDAHQSILATRLRTKELLQAAKLLQSTGIFESQNLFSIECWGGATYDVCLRYLKEDPWVRLQEFSKLNCLTQMLLRGANAVGYSNYPDNLLEKFVIESANNGLDVFRIFDAFNDISKMQVCVDTVLLKTNKICEICICYTGISDKYSLQYYSNVASQLLTKWPDFSILCIKDMSGLMTVQDAPNIINVLRQATNYQKPIHFHTHDTSGGAMATIIKMWELNVEIVDCATSSMSGLTSQPCMQTFMKMIGRDENLLHSLNQYDYYWKQLRQCHWFMESDISTVRAPDGSIFSTQIPGGQISNLHQQAISMGLGNKWFEIQQMYKDVNSVLGQIIKVTPSSKVVGDIALFLVQNSMLASDLKSKEKCANIDFPDSIVDFFRGGLGVPHFGFDDDILKSVLKLSSEEELTDHKRKLSSMQKNLQPYIFDDSDILSQLSKCLYPKVFVDYQLFLDKYYQVCDLPCIVFHLGMKTDESIIIDEHVIKLTRVPAPDQNGVIKLDFMVDGQKARILVVKKTNQFIQLKAANESDLRHVPAQLYGQIQQVFVKNNQIIDPDTPLFKLVSAKMEVIICARSGGKVEIFVSEGDQVKAGGLLALVQ